MAVGLATTLSLPAFEVAEHAGAGGGLVLADKGSVKATLLVDDNDYPAVKLAARFLADDFERVTGHRPSVRSKPVRSKAAIIVGTLGHSQLIAQLVAAGKLTGLDKVEGHWEATTWQLVEKPFPGVDRAFVIVGSDRRGTAYGILRLSEKIGVSPWYWWADVPVAKKEYLAVQQAAPEWDEPAAKYRGIFINDEDWGIAPWARETFEPESGGIGPKTYRRVFELMLRLRLNCLWPAMHECSKEFGATPENFRLADEYGIVAGSSHCEPMLCNNVHWNERTQGPWNYSLNREVIHNYWEEATKARGAYEAVWTLGIRGIHDRGMASPPSAVPDRVKLVQDVFRDQGELLSKNVAAAWGPVAKCFVPYKEVLPLYEAGLAVPEEATLVWVDDNFGYIRRFGLPSERRRSGGAGVYWHLSYYGVPHSYLWINTTAPALMWEELHKAWENDARRLWILNVGDIKPMEVGIDAFARLAWNPEAYGPEAQPGWLRSFASAQFGPEAAEPVAELLGEFYRLGTIRKPELMNRAWACALPAERAEELRAAYAALLARENTLSAKIPAAAQDAFFETVGFPARVLGASGLIFLADREVQSGGSNAADAAAEIARWRSFLEQQVKWFNEDVAGGKWKKMMPGLETAKDLTQWNSQVRWPWGEKDPSSAPAASAVRRVWRAAADRQQDSATARWTAIAGLGSTGRALALLPASLSSTWTPDDATAPALEYAFESGPAADPVLIDFLPTFRLCAGMQLRVKVSVDGAAGSVVEVPGSSGREDEAGPVRSNGVLNNFVEVRIPLENLSPGKHTLRLQAIDPGLVIDRVSLPEK